MTKPTWRVVKDFAATHRQQDERRHRLESTELYGRAEADRLRDQLNGERPITSTTPGSDPAYALRVVLGELVYLGATQIGTDPAFVVEIGGEVYFFGMLMLDTTPTEEPT